VNGWDDQRLSPYEDVLNDQLAGLTEAAPAGHAARILRGAGIAPDRYDMYVCAEMPVGGLYAAYNHRKAITLTALTSTTGRPEAFAAQYQSLHGRRVFPATSFPPGLSTALRTGRSTKLTIEMDGLTMRERAVLETVRSIPPGQMRPVSWVTVMSGGQETDESVVALLARNPAPVLIPCHRVEAQGMNGEPRSGTLGPYPPEIGRDLRTAEGIDMERVDRFAAQRVTYLGSDTTRIYCHPTCAHARRIAPEHQVPFHSAREAIVSGYRECKKCRPLAA
jgi:alkylated DNA nucleotide flippase Atl1